MTTLDEDFAPPASAEGFTWETHLNALLIIEPHSLETGIATTFGEKDAVRATISVVDGTDAGGVYVDTLIFPKALIGQLKSNIGRKVLGRLTQGNPKPGQKPPWLLSDATSEDVAAARRFLAGEHAAAAPATPAPAATQAAQPAGIPAGLTAEQWNALTTEARAALQTMAPK